MVVDNSQLYPQADASKCDHCSRLTTYGRLSEDNIAQAFRSEAGNFDFLDQQNPEVRAIVIAGLEGDTTEGEGVFCAMPRMSWC